MSMLLRQQQCLKEAVTLNDDATSLLRVRPGQESLLRLYQHAYSSRLVGALRDNFGVLPRLMGDEAFNALALAYVQTLPSREPSIRWFGNKLVDFMRTRSDLVAHPALIDMARMEWALRNAFDAADALPIFASSLAAVPAEAWGEMVLHFHPSVQIVPLQWRIEPAWRALHATEEVNEPELAAPVVDEHLLLVWRPNLDTRWRSIANETEAALLMPAMAGEPFGALCELAAKHVGDEVAALHAAQFLNQWVNEGLLVNPRNLSDLDPTHAGVQCRAVQGGGS